MKNPLFTLAIIFLIFSCSKEKTLDTKTTYLEQATIYKSVTKQEYLQASALEKRFIDQIDAAVNSLDIMKKNNPKQEYEAIVTIDKDPANKFNNSILIGIVDHSEDVKKTDAENEPTPDGKCHICGLSSAYSCIREVEKYMEIKHSDTITATVTKTTDNCVDIKYQ